MFREKFEKQFVPKKEGPTEEELEIARKAYEEADPTQYSTLPVEDPLNYVGEAERNRHSPVYTNATDSFIKLNSYKSPEVQLITSRILKGISPVSDVVQTTEENSGFYSKKMNIASVRETHQSPQTAAADLELLNLVFGDRDHQLHSTNAKTSEYDHNVTYDKGKFALYDFDKAKLDEMESKSIFFDHTPESAKLLLDKLLQLKTRISGKDGYQFLESVMRDISLPSEMSLTPESLQDRLLHRLDDAETVTRTLLQKLSWHESSSD